VKTKHIVLCCFFLSVIISGFSNVSFSQDSLKTETIIPDPNDARLFLAPTARPIRKNVLLISDVELFFPMIGYGIENFGSIVGGVSIFPNAENQLIYVNAKITPYRFKYGDIAVGLIYFDWTQKNAYNLIVGYAGATLGTQSASFSGGFGYAFDKYKKTAGLIVLGGEVRLAKDLKAITENWIYTKAYFFPMSFLGLRFFGPAVALDAGALFFWGKQSSEWKMPVLPYGSLTFNFDLFNSKK
jgi:hypothetical protein